MNKIKVILIGAGGRGTTYVRFMKQMGEKYEVVGVAEPIRSRRENIKTMFDLPESACYNSWDEILAQPKMADLAIIATMDEMHTAPALQAIDLGYHLLLEKPVAQTPEECIAIAQAAERKGVSVLVCHVLRYTPFYKKVKELVLNGVIGDIMSAIAVEGVGDKHQSHSFVRGDWHREDETTPMIIAKCCHDLDIIQWIVDKPCKKVSSFGELTYFRPENAPEGAPRRCFEQFCPVREECPYSVEKVYLQDDGNWMKNAVAREISKEFNPTLEEIKEGLRHTNFGACVFYANNDVVDHQIVNMEFVGGVHATLNMNAFNEGGRYIRLFGTKGELYANASDATITVYPFGTREIQSYNVQETEESIVGGHGGGDEGIVYELYDYLSGSYTGYCAADIDVSVKNHMIGFAAEAARHNDTVERVADYCKRFGFDY